MLAVIVFAAACGFLDNQKNASNDSDSKSGGYKPKELTVICNLRKMLNIRG